MTFSVVCLASMHEGCWLLWKKKRNKQKPHLFIPVCFPDFELHQNIFPFLTNFGLDLAKLCFRPGHALKYLCKQNFSLMYRAVWRGTVSLCCYAMLRSQLEVTLVAVALTAVRTKAVITTPWWRQWSPSGLIRGSSGSSMLEHSGEALKSPIRTKQNLLCKDGGRERGGNRKTEGKKEKWQLEITESKKMRNAER